MPNDDPFKGLAAALDAQAEEAKPLTEDEVQELVLGRHQAFLGSLDKFNEVLNERNASIALAVDSVNVKDRIIHANILISKGGTRKRVMPIFFQGSAFWVGDKDFVKFARRENEHGSWRSDEIEGFERGLSGFLAGILK